MLSDTQFTHRYSAKKVWNYIVVTYCELMAVLTYQQQQFDRCTADLSVTVAVHRLRSRTNSLKYEKNECKNRNCDFKKVTREVERTFQ